MCSEIYQFSSFSRGMPDCRDSQKIVLVKQQEEEQPLQLEDPESCPEIGSESVRENEKEILLRDTDQRGEGEVKTAENEPENSVRGDDDDGFKTPTSSDHKIPAITQCPPPPPRKARTQPSNRKRKESTDGARRSLRFVEMEEVESIFRQAQDEEDVGSKRLRKATESDSLLN